MGTTFCRSGKFHGGLSPRTKNVRLTLERGAQEVQAHTSFRIVEDIDEETIMGHRLHKLNVPRRKITGQEVSSRELLTKAERHTIKAAKTVGEFVAQLRSRKSQLGHTKTEMKHCVTMVHGLGKNKSYKQLWHLRDQIHTRKFGLRNVIDDDSNLVKDHHEHILAVKKYHKSGIESRERKATSSGKQARIQSKLRPLFQREKKEHEKAHQAHGGL